MKHRPELELVVKRNISLKSALEDALKTLTDCKEHIHDTDFIECRIDTVLTEAGILLTNENCQPSAASVKAAERIESLYLPNDRDEPSVNQMANVIESHTGVGELVNELESVLNEIQKYQSLGYTYEPWFKKARALLAKHKAE